MNKPKFDPEALKALKTKKNLSAQDLSDLSGVPLSTVNRILRGEGEPNINSVAALVHALGGSMDDVCGFPKSSSVDNTEGYKLLVQHQQEIIAEKRWWIKVLAGALGFVILFVLGIVTYDIFNGDVGWAQYEAALREQAQVVMHTITDWFKT